MAAHESQDVARDLAGLLPQGDRKAAHLVQRRVDEALCFGWIDSTQKKLDVDRTAQRFTPRRPGSPTSEMNKARARRLVRTKRMTAAGLNAIGSPKTSRLVIAADMRAAFERDPIAWKRFQRFPASYRRIRVAFVEGARVRPDEFKRRLGSLVRKSASGSSILLTRSGNAFAQSRPTPPTPSA
jgi:hypothetical protein